MKNNRQHKLTEKQERFCRHYLDTDGNASEAYRMAYDCSKMQPSTVHYSAWEMMNNPKITQRIDTHTAQEWSFQSFPNLRRRHCSMNTAETHRNRPNFAFNVSNGIYP